MTYFPPPRECSRHTIFPGVEIMTAAGDQLMLSVVDLRPHAEVLPHSHPHEQMGILLEGELDFTIGEQRQVVRPGEMWRIPSGVPHHCKAGSDGAKAIDVFCPVREEYR